MELTAQSLYLPRPSISLPRPYSQCLIASTRFSNIPLHLQFEIKAPISLPRTKRNVAVFASSTSPDSSQLRWLLQPVGDGDSRHIGFKVDMPGAIEISSNEVIVGRVPGSADIVIPVATVSGRHARIRPKGDSLQVIDLESTNGTFIDEKRLKPGVVATVSSGNLITFGDTNLAIFRVSKLEAQLEEKEDSSSLTQSVETLS